MALARGKSLGDHGYKAPEITTIILDDNPTSYKYMRLTIDPAGEISDSLQPVHFPNVRI